MKGYTPTSYTGRRCAPPSAREPRPTPRPTRSASACSRATTPRPPGPGARRAARPPDRVRRGEGLVQEGRAAAPGRRRSAPPARSPSASASGTSSRPSARGSPARSASRGRATPARRGSPGPCPRASTRPTIGRARWPRERCWARTGSTATSRATTTNGSKGPEEVEIVSGEDLSAAVREVDVVAEHQNTARDLQNLPSNDLTPAKLADHALRRAAEIDGLEGGRLRPGPDREARDGRPAGRREGLARGAALHRAALRRRGRRPAARRWSARRSPSTPAGSRSSPRRRCRR